MSKTVRWLLIVCSAALGVALCIGAATLILLTSLKADLTKPSFDKLYGAAAKGDIVTLRHCLDAGISPNQFSRWGWNHENFGQTPLTVAAFSGRVEIIRLLLEKGADPNLLDSGTEFPHMTPLATAAASGKLEVCRVLLEGGADPNVPTNPKQPGDPGNWTALDWAYKEPAVAELLRQHGAMEGTRRGGKAKSPRFDSPK